MKYVKDNANKIHKKILLPESYGNIFLKALCVPMIYQGYYNSRSYIEKDKTHIHKLYRSQVGLVPNLTLHLVIAYQ